MLFSLLRGWPLVLMFVGHIGLCWCLSAAGPGSLVKEDDETKTDELWSAFWACMRTAAWPKAWTDENTEIHPSNLDCFCLVEVPGGGDGTYSSRLWVAAWGQLRGRDSPFHWAQVFGLWARTHTDMGEHRNSTKKKPSFFLLESNQSEEGIEPWPHFNSKNKIY